MSAPVLSPDFVPPTAAEGRSNGTITALSPSAAPESGGTTPPAPIEPLPDFALFLPTLAPAPEVVGGPAKPESPAAASATSLIAPGVRELDVSAIQQVLDRYKGAYDQLDARAASMVWPSVDVRGLEKAFARLRSQDLVFHLCVIDVARDKASALCVGALTYVPRVGTVTPRTEPHSWAIQLERAAEEWRVLSVTGR